MIAIEVEDEDGQVLVPPFEEVVDHIDFIDAVSYWIAANNDHNGHPTQDHFNAAVSLHHFLTCWDREFSSDYRLTIH